VWAALARAPHVHVLVLRATAGDALGRALAGLGGWPALQELPLVVPRCSRARGHWHK
jgi:hypothetical protein